MCRLPTLILPWTTSIIEVLPSPTVYYTKEDRCSHVTEVPHSKSGRRTQEPRPQTSPGVCSVSCAGEAGKISVPASTGSIVLQSKDGVKRQRSFGEVLWWKNDICITLSLSTSPLITPGARDIYLLLLTVLHGASLGCCWHVTNLLSPPSWVRGCQPGHQGGCWTVFQLMEWAASWPVT